MKCGPIWIAESGCNSPQGCYNRGMSRAKQNAAKAAAVWDQKIADRIRTIRREKDVSQEALAERIGVTFQQVQKYEKARNRVSASRLCLIAGALDVPIERFFEGV